MPARGVHRGTVDSFLESSSTHSPATRVEAAPPVPVSAASSELLDDAGNGGGLFDIPNSSNAHRNLFHGDEDNNDAVEQPADTKNSLLFGSHKEGAVDALFASDVIETAEDKYYEDERLPSKALASALFCNLLASNNSRPRIV